MTPLSKTLGTALELYPTLKIQYVHPVLYLSCKDARFEGLDDENRRALFLQNFGNTRQDAEDSLTSASVLLNLEAPSELGEDIQDINPSPAHHWIEYLAHPSPSINRPTPISKLIHFYGYKGGQARSTVLAMLSRVLADDGYRVLAIDADVEAPSLHRQYGTKVTKLDSTLLGCVQYRLKPQPQSVYIPKGSSFGSVDLIACRPSDPSFDLANPLKVVGR